MILSRNEVTAVLHKAARGQGVPLGHIDVFVPAAVRALALFENFADEVTDALKGPHAATRVIMAGPIAIDALLAGAEKIPLPDLDSPKLLQCMMYNSNDINGLCFVLEVSKVGYSLSQSQKAKTPKRTKGPLNIPDDAWNMWQSWAARTYVPATDASRASGAGAGLTDND